MTNLKIAFLDRDGVINVNTGHPHKIEDIRFTERCMEGLRALQELGFELAIITNQAGIARGYYSEADFHRLTAWMLEQFRSQGVEILEVSYCPHLAGSAIPEYDQACGCRKPEPGMILDIVAAQNAEVDLKASILIGDNVTDIEAGQRAGVGHLYLVGNDYTPEVAARLGCQYFASLAAVADFLQQPAQC